MKYIRDIYFISFNFAFIFPYFQRRMSFYLSAIVLSHTNIAFQRIVSVNINFNGKHFGPHKACGIKRKISHCPAIYSNKLKYTDDQIIIMNKLRFN